MTELSQDKKEFIDNNFYETQKDNELDRHKFDLLTQPEELHYLADKHNWDDGVKVLQWIAESKNCSQATALQIFWLAQPQEFQIYKLTENLKDSHANETFNLIKTIYKNYPDNFYTQSDIHFDPTTYIETEQQVPDFMKQQTNGEETYIYLDKNEVDSWFGEILENKINRSGTTMELFNIASFTKSVDKAKLILKHPLCDKGIAIMLFWRLKTFANMWYETNSIVTEIINKVRNNEHPEIIAYNPNTDTEIKMKEPKPKWAIPEIMTRLMSVSIIQLASLLILFTSCLSQANKPKQSPGTRDTIDSCSIAKPFENIQMTESMVKADYTGVLNNYIGSDTTKLDFQHFFENGKLMKSVFYYPNGKVQEAYNYKCGALNGNQQFFYSDGKLAKIIPYSYGYKEGVGKIYDEKGNLRQQVIFTADSMIGQPKTFDEKGNLLK